MCGVIGLQLKDVRSDDISSIRSLFYETQVRGMHATGVSYLKNGKVNTIKEPIPANRFLQKYNPSDWIDEDGNMTAIAHCRYSTSDLRFNQPIADEELSLVHNGVISQELPERWKELYDIDCETANDSELLFHRPDMNAWKGSSISALLLRPTGIEYMRNGKRPLWRGEVDQSDNIVYASTYDILERSNFKFFCCERVGYTEGLDLQP